MRGLLKMSLEKAIAEAEAFKAEHGAWFDSRTGRWKYNTAGHRRSEARFIARMRAVDDAIDAMRCASERL